MKREGWILALLAAVPMGLWEIVPAQAATSISSCPYTITAPGAYTVTADLSCPGTAITVNASNVDLNLNGHTLSGGGAGDGVFVQSQASVSIHSGTVQGFFNGVELQGSANCKVSSITASQNGDTGILGRGAFGLVATGCTATQNSGYGIAVFDSGGNSVTHNVATGNYGGIAAGGSFASSFTDNIASGNNCVGLDFHTVSGNMVDHNTTDRNPCVGVALHNGSNGNTITRNSATANGSGIWIAEGSARNTVQNNALNGNGVGILAYDGATGNTIQGNTASLNSVGIWLQSGVTGNTVQGNTALTSGSFDVEDDNPGCDSNHWLNNRFVTFQVAGGSDGGCLLGQPNAAQLFITGGGNPTNLAPGSCITLDLKVRFAGRSDYLDVTSWSETSFSAPGHGTVTGNQLCVGPADANSTFTVYGRYADPVSGVFTTGTISVHVHK